MSILIDELGRPILLFADEDNKKRTKGLEAYKVSIIVNSNFIIISLTSLLLEELLQCLNLLLDLKEWTKCLFLLMEKLWSPMMELP